MRNHVRYLHRTGAALLAGTLLAGAAGLIAAGAADAASPTTASATLAPNGPTNILSTTPNPVPVAGYTINVSGTVALGDAISLSVMPSGNACSPSDYVAFAAPGNVTVTDSAGDTWHATLGTNSCGSPSGTTSNTLLLTVTTAPAAETSPTLTVSNLTYTANGATAGRVIVTGSYMPESGGSTPFTSGVPSNANVQAIAVTSNTPAAILSPGASNQAVSNITLTEPSAGSLTGWVCLTLSGGNTFNTSTSAPTVSTLASSGAVVANSGTLASVGGTSSAAPTVAFQITTPSTSAGIYTISNLHVNAGSTLGQGTLTITYAQNSSCTSGSAITASSTAAAFTVGSVTQNTYGQTADATVAAEFEAAFPNGNSIAVLATDADPYDALSAAYLEGKLGTGLLITPPTSLGSDAALALRLEGVQTVYVLGGSAAVSQAVVAQLQSTPTYTFGGTATAGGVIQVVGPIYGSDGTADGTAAQIATYFGATPGSANVTNAYSAGSGTAGGGLYNDTVGTASTTGPGGTAATAIVVADTDWQDAVTASVMSYKDHFPIVLTPATSLGTDAATALTNLGVRQVIVMGGQLAISDTVVGQIQAMSGGITVLRIAGQDGTDTAAQLANFEIATNNAGLGWAPTKLLVAQGSYWSDALGAAGMGGTTGEPIVLTENPTTVGQYLTALLNEAGSPTGIQGDTGIGGLVILGGPLAVPPATVTALEQALAAG